MTEARSRSASTFSPACLSTGGTIEDLLEERGWTQRELATRTGFTAKHIQELLKGRAPVIREAAVKLKARESTRYIPLVHPFGATAGECPGTDPRMSPNWSGIVVLRPSGPSRGAVQKSQRSCQAHGLSRVAQDRDVAGTDDPQDGDEA